MKHLEERIKDRLEGYESSLPEGDLTEFNALLDKVSSKSKRKVASLVWLVPTVIAAGLLLLFTLNFNPESEQVEAPGNKALATDINKTLIPDHKHDIAIDAKSPTAQKQTYAQAKILAEDKEESSYAEELADGQPEEQTIDESDLAAVTSQSETARNDEEAPSHVSKELSNMKKQVKTGKYIAGALGGTGTLALAYMLPSVLRSGWGEDLMTSPPEDTWTEPSVDHRTGKDKHYMPLRTGLSLRLPLSKRWSLTTGLDYSLYSSRIGYTISGKRRQSAHYLGIPIRADYTLVRSRWLDIYIGAGASVDFCVDAHQESSQVTKDGVGFSMVGAGGLQLNFTRHLGLYLEPTLSWNVLSDRQTLGTYKSEHPLMFSVSTGIRITLPNLSTKQ